MATATTIRPPVELPAQQDAFPFSQSQPDIHSPGWIPLLNSSDITATGADHEPLSEKEVSPYNSSSFSPIATPNVRTPRRPSLANQLRHVSAAGTDRPASELEAVVPSLPSLPPPPPPPPPPTTKKFNAELPATRPQSRYFERKQPIQSSEPASDSADTDGTAESLRVASIGTSSLLEEQVYTLPSTTTNKDDATAIPLPLSASPSIASLRKAVIAAPVSKFSRKPVPGTSRVQSQAPSVHQSPLPSPKLKPLPEPIPAAAAAHPPRVESLVTAPVVEIGARSPTMPPPPPPEPENIPSAAQNAAMSSSKSTKSTTSQRKKRALHSHPSNIPIKSRSNSDSSVSDAAVVPASNSRPSSSHRRGKSTDSRTGGRLTLFDSQTPTPAPTTPLPELPSHARTPQKTSVSFPGLAPLALVSQSLALDVPPKPQTTTETLLPSPNSFSTAIGSPNLNQSSSGTVSPTPANISTSPKVSSPSRYRTSPLPALPEPAVTTNSSLQQPRPAPQPPGSRDHTSLTNFMTTSSTLIFRRFDEVHVQLLVHLQDEIAQHERDLQALDSRAQPDREVKRMKILRELRSLVAEYDAMLSSWSTMQAQKAKPDTVDSFRRWLDRFNHSNSSKSNTSGAQQDLAWLDAANEKGDLSSIEVGGGDATAGAGASRGGENVPVNSGGAINGGASAPSRTAGWSGIVNGRGGVRSTNMSGQNPASSSSGGAGFGKVVSDLFGGCAGKRKGKSLR